MNDKLTIEIEKGFYLDPQTKRMFYLNIVNNQLIVPVFVKSDMKDWRKIGNGRKTK